MKLDTHEDYGEFETTTAEEDGYFSLSITKESDISVDGGYTFEPVCNSIHLNMAGAFELMKELESYLNKVEN